MKLLSKTLSLSILVLAFNVVDAAEPVKVNHAKDDGKVIVAIGDKLFTEYRYRGYKKPILYPIIGPHEIEMTRNYPMKTGVTGEANDHPHHQSLHYNHGLMNGVDFWHGNGNAQIVHDSLLRCEVVDGVAIITSKNSWNQGKKVICTDTTTIRCGLTKGGRYIDFSINIHASEGDLTMGDTKEGSMSIRTHPALRLQGSVAKGKAVNSEGVSGKAIWGKAAKWVDYYGPINDKTVGIGIFDHPANPRHPTTWHARDYGLITANPFGHSSFKGKGQDGTMKIKAGESVTFTYRFFFHEGNVEEADIPKCYQAWATTSVTGKKQ
jgi:hypothetical protein